MEYIDDEYIINKFWNKEKQCCISSRIQHMTQNEKNYLLNRFEDDEKISITIYRIAYKVYNLKICPICKINKCKLDLRNIDNDYQTYTCCSKFCKGEHWKNKQKEILSKYNVENWFQLDSVKNKIVETNLLKYGVKYPAQNKDIYKKVESTMLKRYGVKAFIYTEKGDKAIHNAKVKEKEFNTKRKNKTLNTSKIEIESYKIIYEKFPDVIYQYKDKERYPFACDFYIPNLDLFIECNYHWTHGGRPYKGTNDDKYIVNLWKSTNKEYYNNAIATWTIRDVNKRNTAKENNLNWIEFWNIKELQKFLKEVEDDPQNWVQYYKDV